MSSAAAAPMRLHVPQRALRGPSSINLAALRGAAATARAAGDLVAARALLVRSVELNPAQDDVLVDLAEVCLRLGVAEDALAALGRVRGPLPPRAAVLHGQALIEVGLFSAAITVLDNLLRDLPGDLQVRVLLAEALRLAGQPGTDRHTAAVLRVRPDHPGALLVEGRARLDAGRPAAGLAIAAGPQARAAGTSAAAELALLAVDAELALDRPAAAEQRLAQLGGGVARVPAVIERRARAQLAQGLALAARLSLEGLRRAGALSPAGGLSLAETYVQLGDPEEGLAVLADPTGLSAAELPRREQLRGRLHEQRGELAAAAACYGAAFDAARRGRAPPGPLVWADAPRLGRARVVDPGGARASGGYAPIFIVGAPGAGVRLVGRVVAGWAGAGPPRLPLADALSRHHRSLELEDGPPEGILDRMSARELDALALRWAGGPPSAAAPPVEASATGLLTLGMVARLFPDARVIIVEREPMDAILSAWSGIRPGDGPVDGLLDLAERDVAARALAARWRRSLPLRMATLHYEALVANPARTLAATRRALGLGPLPLARLVAGVPARRAGWTPLDPTSVGRWTRFPALAESIDIARRLSGGR